MFPAFYSSSKYYSILALCVLVFCSGKIFSNPGPMKWGKVTAEEIKLKVCPYDSTASAVVLAEYGEVKYTYEGVYIHKHVRIKILDQKAINRANVTLSYYAEDRFERIINVSAQTINISPQGKPVIQEVSAKQIFDIQENEKWKQKRFTLPAVSVGSIIEYDYTTLSKSRTFLEGWVFQNDVPTLHSEFEVLVPEGLNFMVFYQGARLIQAYDGKTTNRWVLKNLPALVDEPYVNNYYDYAEKIRFQLAGYEKRDVMSGGHDEVKFLNSWEKLSEQLLANESYYSILNKSHTAKDILKTLKLETATSEDKVVSIYNYVKQTIAWNGEHRLFPDKNVSQLLESKQGNSAEINLFLSLLLREAGLQANPLIISTRKHGKVLRSYPLLTQFNHVLSHTLINDKEYVLDATDPLRSYKLLDKEDLNLSGYLLNKQKPGWVEVKTNTETKQVVSLIADLTSIQNPVYKANVMYRGFNALHKRKEYLTKTKDDFISEQLKVSFADYTLKDFTCDNAEEIDQDFVTTYSLISSDQINTTNKAIYFQPILINNFKETPFKHTLRRLPVEFDYPFTYHYVINIKIPEGYQVQELPKPVVVKMPHDIAEFKYNVQSQGHQIQVVTNVTIKGSYVPADYYPYLQQFYDQIVSKYSEFIVLQKL
jgi:hypothetical protein